MPSPPQEKTCEWCGAKWITRSKKARTCSPLCRARLRETEKPTIGSTPRKYPSELVDRIKSMYDDGMTIREIQDEIKGVKVQRVIERYCIETRPAIKRDQHGENNDSWKGDAASYQAFHLRVYSSRGAPKECSRCGDTSAGRYEWANLTGHYEDINDYQRMCVSCHRNYDAKRREETGRRTSPIRR